MDNCFPLEKYKFPFIMEDNGSFGDYEIILLVNLSILFYWLTSEATKVIAFARESLGIKLQQYLDSTTNGIFIPNKVRELNSGKLDA